MMSLNFAFYAKRQCISCALSKTKLSALIAICFLLVLSINVSVAQNITTVAGGGVGDGGQAINAVMSPWDVAADMNGNIYIADWTNNRIRKVSPNGAISTVAGNGNAGFSGDGGLAIDASLNNPTGIVVDKNGILFIADQKNERIRKVDVNGIITTVAGNGSRGVNGDGSLAINASLNSPADVAIDSQGNLYIADVSNGRIRKVSTNGVITTVAGNGSYEFDNNTGPATSTDIGRPVSIAVDNNDNIYISENYYNRVRKINTSGTISTIAGNGNTGFSGDGGLAKNAMLESPQGVAVDNNGNIYIADGYNRRVRKVNASGVISTLAGNGTYGYSGDGGTANNASFKTPYGVAVDLSGNVYITDLADYRIRKINTAGVISTFAGNGTLSYRGDNGAAADASINRPQDVVLDNRGNFYFTDQDNHVIRKVNSVGIITTVAGNGVKGYSGDGGIAINASLNTPAGITIDKDGNLYFADYLNNRVRKVSNTGVITTVAGNGVRAYAGDGGSAINASLSSPSGVTVDANGNIYIADEGNYRVRKVGTNGIMTTVAGTGTRGSSGDNGPATNARLSKPVNVFIDVEGNLFIADESGNRIRKVNSSGIITTVAGNGNGGFSGDGGPAINAELGNPKDITVDKYGNLYIADHFNQRIRKVDANGVISTITGTGIFGFSGDGGLATNANLNSPAGLYADDNGNLYIADTGNNRIRKVEASSNADLASLGLSTSYLPVFDPAITSYKGNVVNQITAVMVTPTVSDANATVTVNGTATESGKWVAVPLAVGKNTIAVVVTAQDGTTKTYTVEVTRAYAPLALTTSQTNVACYNGSTGSATVSVTGGATPYTYSWAPLGGTTATASNLKAGTYTVTVTDAQSQTATATVTITQPEALATTGSQTNIACNGWTNGSATVSVSGGTAPYTYAWTGSASTTATASNLAAGNYTVTVTDANNCTVTRSFTITQPNVLTTTVSKTDVTTAGGSDGTATVSVSGGTAPYSYSWWPKGGTAAIATGLPAGDYIVTVRDVKGCSFSNSVKITTRAVVSTETVWLGTKSENWHDAENWSNGVPTTALDVVIKAGTYMPDIPNNEPNPGYLVRNLTIESGATFNLKTVLDLHGNLINHGTINTYHEKYDDIYQVVSRVHVHKPATIGGTKPVAFYQLWIEQNAPVNLATDISVLYNLSLKSDLNTNGKKLTLLSQRWYTINVQNEGGEVNGAVTVQRYIDPTYNSGPGYRHFSSPVTNTTVADLVTTGFSPVVNAAYNTAEDLYAVKPFPTVLGYDQSRLSNTSEVKQKFDFGWYSPAATSTRLVPGMGYSANIAASAKVDFLGTLNNGDITVTDLGRAATGAAGWHLLGNPYPSTLTWSSLYKPAGMDDAIYVYRSTGQYAGNYISYVNGVGNDEANYIAAMQGFFVRVTNGPVDLTFTNSARSDMDAQLYRKATDERPKLQLQLTDKRGKIDEAFVYFQEDATTIANGKYDAFKVLTYHDDRPTLFARVNTDALAIKGLPVENGVQSLPLEVYVPESGEYTFSAAKLVNFPAIAEVLLEDKETNQTYNLKQSAEVKLALSPSTDPHRFVLRFSAVAGKPLSSGDLVTTDVQVLVYPNPSAGNVNLIVNGLKANTAAVQVKLYNSVGQAVMQKNYAAQQVRDGIQLPTSDLATGVYYLQLNLDGKVITKKLVLQR